MTRRCQAKWKMACENFAVYNDQMKKFLVNIDEQKCSLQRSNGRLFSKYCNTQYNCCRFKLVAAIGNYWKWYVAQYCKQESHTVMISVMNNILKQLEPLEFS